MIRTRPLRPLVVLLAALAAGSAHAAPPGATAASRGALPARSAPVAAAATAPAPVAAAPAPKNSPGTARVTYVTGGSVYLDAGRSDGLNEGDTLVVARDGATIARLRAAFLSSHGASCDTLPGSTLPRGGDVARFTPRLAVGPPAAAATPPAAGSAVLPPSAPGEVMPHAATVLVPNPPRARASRLRGRLGARLLAIQSREAGDMTQPALDMRLEAVNAGGLPIDLLSDVRGRRTVRTSTTGPDQVESSTRVYRLAASVHDASARYRLTLGRQASPLLSSVSLFDGGLGEWGSRRWDVGAFSGTQPDPVQLTVSREILQSGFYLAAHQAPLAARRWSLAFGGVTSTARGQVNRDFVFVQGNYHDALVSMSYAQEADIERGWRRDSVGSAFMLTSSFLTVNVQPAEGLSLNAGYDGRRNVRLYRDRETPETAFDDRFREGGWVGASVELGPHARVSGDARSMGGSSDRANAWSASGELMRLTTMNGRLRARYSRSDAPVSRSELISLGVALDPFDGAHLDFSGGTRSTRDVAVNAEDRANWTSTDLDLSFMRRLLLSLSWEHTAGSLEHVDQEYGGLSVRF